MSDTLLIERPLLGFTGASIELHFDPPKALAKRGTKVENHRVIIRDLQGEIVWEPKNRKEAKDMYFHPFVFGYDYRPEMN